MRKFYLFAASLVLLTAVTGCSSDDEKSHALYKKGENAQKAGNGAEAVAAYKELIAKRENCVYSHLQLATVYDEMLNDPLMAIMHYRVYLEKNPQASDAAEVKAWMERAERRYFDSIKHKFPAPAEDKALIAELENKLTSYQARYTAYREEAVILRKKLAQAQAQAKKKTAAPAKKKK